MFSLIFHSLFGKYILYISKWIGNSPSPPNLQSSNFVRAFNIHVPPGSLIEQTYELSYVPKNWQNMTLTVCFLSGSLGFKKTWNFFSKRCYVQRLVEVSIRSWNIQIVKKALKPWSSNRPYNLPGELKFTSNVHSIKECWVHYLEYQIKTI